MFTVDATGCIISGVTMRNAAVTASTACIQTFKTSTNAVGTVLRNSFIWGPEDASVAAATGGWNLICIEGGDNYFENLVVGYGWPVNCGSPQSSTRLPCLVKYKKSVYNASHWENCLFHAEFKQDDYGFIMQCYSPSGGVFHVFRNCQFINVGSTALSVAMRSDAGEQALSAGNNFWYFDADCAFMGVTDIASAHNESYIRFSPAHRVSTDNSGLVYCGLAQQFDHTSG